MYMIMNKNKESTKFYPGFLDVGRGRRIIYRYTENSTTEMAKLFRCRGYRFQYNREGMGDGGITFEQPIL